MIALINIDFFTTLNANFIHRMPIHIIEISE